jgi:hypothetical protein
MKGECKSAGATGIRDSTLLSESCSRIAQTISIRGGHLADKITRFHAESTT